MFDEHIPDQAHDAHSSKVTSKWPDIPALRDYSVEPDQSFWAVFPSRPLPTSAETAINTDILSTKIEESKHLMTIHQYKRALKALDYLRNGAPACQKSDLPGCFVNNARNTLLHGQAVTENIATWIKEGYASGPFSDPPCENFRVNPLLVAVQPGKIRTILNVSSPDGDSYNSNVDDYETEKVRMASAKLFSECLLDCGVNANMSKYDLTAAYKQVPCKVQNLRLQGFKWLGKYFVETRQVFGAKTSVCNYDIVGETLKLLALLRSDIAPNLVLRQVDDVPCVSGESSNWCSDFSSVYESLCAELNVGLAPVCPINDKAFVNQKRGKVLGVMFDSTDLSWRLSDTKISKALNCIKMTLSVESVTLRDFQRLLGRINDISQMCSFLKIFIQPLNKKSYEDFKLYRKVADPYFFAIEIQFIM